MISVIINVYNGEKYIKRCLDCIINQTYNDLEIIIVNDGSTDDTLNICESYNDSRIKIINQKNIGISSSRNIGIKAATGEYIYFIDSDDFIEIDTLEYLYNLCNKYNSNVTTCMAKIVYSDNIKKRKLKEKIKIKSTEKMLKNIFLEKEYAVYIWNKLIKKELFDNIEFENRIISDTAFTHKLILKTDNIVVSNQIKYYYFKHSESICGKKASLERLIDTFDVFIERYYYIKNIYPNLIENDASLLKTIIELYLKGEKKLEEYLNKKDTLKLYKKIFSLKILVCNIGIREKIKILLFRINPKLNKSIINTYLELKKMVKK